MAATSRWFDRCIGRMRLSVASSVSTAAWSPVKMAVSACANQWQSVIRWTPGSWPCLGTKWGSIAVTYRASMQHWTESGMSHHQQGKRVS